MASPRRIARLESFLKREIVEVLLHKLNDPRIGFVSVTKVELTRDCSHLKVFVSVLGNDAARGRVMGALKRGKSYIGREACRHLQLHTMPTLSFVLDRSIEKGIEICKIIDKLSEERQSRESQEDEPNKEDQE